MRNAEGCDAITGGWYCYGEDSGGEGDEGGRDFPLPLDCHHLEILSAAYLPVLPTPALTTPLMVWTVEGYLTMCLISVKSCIGQSGL